MANRPKGKLFALLAIFVAIGLVTATGAFSSVTADRTATISTASDANALLGIQEQGTTNVIETNANNELRINFDAAGGGGVNVNATTWVNNSIKITNNGADTVQLWITHDGGSGILSFYNVTAGTSSTHDVSAVDGSNPPSVATLDQGDSVIVSIKVDTDRSPGGSLSMPTQITIHADTDTPGAATTFDPAT